MAEPGVNTHREILQQPEIWPDTVRRVRGSGISGISRPVVTGAGTSAYAATAIEAAWPGARAVPSTELLLDYASLVAPDGVVLSLARSGDSPESVAVVGKIQKALPGVRHVAITANPNGKLANWKGVEAILLDPRTNDRSLVMTSSYSNLVMGGIALACPGEAEAAIPSLCQGWDRRFEEHEKKARTLAQNPPQRLIALASSALFGAAREAALKTLESTAGRVAALAETYLGLRLGLDPDNPSPGGVINRVVQGVVIYD